LSPNKSDSIGFFGVYDGHGDGGISSVFVAENIIPYFTSSKEWLNYSGDLSSLEPALIQACGTADIKLKPVLSKGNSVLHGGSTGVMAVISSDMIMIGNVGDSRCVLVQKCEQSPSEPEVSDVTKELVKLSMKNEPDVNLKMIVEKVVVKALSNDHKPNLENEKARIERAGMKVEDETFTIDGVTNTISKICKSDSDRIAVSRAFGDFDYKDNSDLNETEQAIICVPEITIHKRDHARDLFLILACDGVYDVMSNDDVGEFVVEKVNELSTTDDTSLVLPEVGDLLLQECLHLGSSDNMSVLIVALPKCHRGDCATRTLMFADV
jgi:serine/threonine protein phosphatase PrpC